MKKIMVACLLFTFINITCEAQDSLQDLKGARLHFTATVTTDSGIQHGFLWKVSDSSISLSTKRNVGINPPLSQSFTIPAENISEITVKDSRFQIAAPIAGAIFGFVLTAGLWANEDVNEDGRLSFWELLFGAIDGVTSQGRARRRTAIWVGIGGGAVGLIAGAFSKTKITISFPLGDRKHSFITNKERIRLFMQ
ncbi:MAG: hypothetical protein JST87_07305 [Bacteroidetes bacterium]|nr:hypothetical protein [Bacteroidota bacterium]MBS1935464.1 hypothetical protein [Bacteroidota bacterium]